jgi:hypothetical protein
MCFLTGNSSSHTELSVMMNENRKKSTLKMVFFLFVIIFSVKCLLQHCNELNPLQILSYSMDCATSPAVCLKYKKWCKVTLNGVKWVETVEKWIKSGVLCKVDAN